MFNDSPDTASKPSTPFIQELHHKMARLKYTPPRQQQRGTYIPQHLRNCKYVFVRNDSVKKPLTPAYQGPFKVIRHSNKHITTRRGDTTDTVSIDRTKPAFLSARPHGFDTTKPSLLSARPHGFGANLAITIDRTALTRQSLRSRPIRPHSFDPTKPSLPFDSSARL